MEGTERINKIIEEFLAPIAGPVKVECSLDFYFCELTDEIGWSFLTTEHQDHNFNVFFEEELGCRPVHNFVYSILHEYGHKMTMSSFPTEKRIAYIKARGEIDNIESTDEKDFAYFRLPMEVAASKWAVDYINSHYDEVYAWCADILVPAMNEFLSNNEAVAEIVAILESEENE